MKKSIVLAGIVGLLSVTTALPVFAAGWTQGTGANSTKYWYDLGNGSFHKNGWQWLDGNNDGIAECYYFDAEGWMLVNTTTPDGYTVNGDGQWVENGAVKTQAVQKAAASKTTAAASTSTKKKDLSKVKSVPQSKIKAGDKTSAAGSTGHGPVAGSTDSASFDDWSNSHKDAEGAKTE